MIHIKLGNDLPIEWKIVRNGTPEVFVNKTLELFIYNRYGKEQIKTFSLESNTLRFVFSGKNQKYSGEYGLLLVINAGSDNMSSVDLDRAFCLTNHTDCGCGETVELMSDIGLPANGLSAYELALLNGFVGSEQDWLQSLSKPATDAAEELHDTIDIVGIGETRVIDLLKEKEAEGYWNIKGEIARSPSYYYTKPIFVNQGDIVRLIHSNATQNVLPIVKVTSTNTYISSLVQGIYGIHDYSVITSAGFISFSITSGVIGTQALIIPCKLASLLVEPAGGYCHSLYETAGAKWNAATGMWELNGIDLSVKEIAIAYNDSLGLKNKRLDEVCHNSQMKTNFPSLPIGSFGSLSAIACFANCNKIESIKFNNSTVCYFSSIAYMCIRCRSLHTITPIIDVTNCTVNGNVVDAFKSCSNLKNVKLRGLNIDVSFSDSPSLSTDSILYLISNSANKSITITLHPDAYAHAMSDSSITAALAEKPLITIAK